MPKTSHKAGYVSIIGKPNVGKSTLMNQLVGERLSIITSKAQTTRHRILGIVSDDNYQIIYSDTPGIIESKYELHKAMMDFVTGSIIDADVIIFITDIYEKYDEEDVIDKLKKSDTPVILLINKVDQVKDKDDILEKIAYWKDKVDPQAIIPISALEKYNLEAIQEEILNFLPEHPEYFPKDTLTDKPTRFFVAETVREKIFEQYKKEVPYSTEVIVEAFKEDEDIIRINAIILVERDSQKGIIIGHGGQAIKNVGIKSRQSLEKFFDKKIHIELFVKVEKDWRKEEGKLKRLGYKG